MNGLARTEGAHTEGAHTDGATRTLPRDTDISQSGATGAGAPVRTVARAF
ncbi:hypothetical protein SALBM217S_02039 [Streptomyces griseoloalbus]